MKHRKKDKGLAVRCLILLLHWLERNEPEDGAMEEKDLIKESTCVWLPSSNKRWLTKPMALASGFCIASKIRFCFVPALGTYEEPKFARCSSTCLTWDVTPRECVRSPVLNQQLTFLWLGLEPIGACCYSTPPKQTLLSVPGLLDKSSFLRLLHEDTNTCAHSVRFALFVP